MAGQKERRLKERIRARGIAWIFDQAGCVIEVEMRDVSSSGARVAVPYGIALPKRFNIRLTRDGGDIPAEIVWRAGRELGMRFMREGAFEPVFVPLPKGVSPGDTPTPPPTTPPTPRVSLAELRGMASKARAAK